MSSIPRNCRPFCRHHEQNNCRFGESCLYQHHTTKDSSASVASNQTTTHSPYTISQPNTASVGSVNSQTPTELSYNCRSPHCYTAYSTGSQQTTNDISIEHPTPTTALTRTGIPTPCSQATGSVNHIFASHNQFNLLHTVRDDNEEKPDRQHPQQAAQRITSADSDTDDSADKWITVGKHGSYRRQQQCKPSSDRSTTNSSSPRKNRCKECQIIFEMTADNIAWFTSRGWNIPLRCKQCRHSRRQKLPSSPTIHTTFGSKNITHQKVSPEVRYKNILKPERPAIKNRNAPKPPNQAIPLDEKPMPPEASTEPPDDQENPVDSHSIDHTTSFNSRSNQAPSQADESEESDGSRSTEPLIESEESEESDGSSSIERPIESDESEGSNGSNGSKGSECAELQDHDDDKEFNTSENSDEAPPDLEGSSTTSIDPPHSTMFQITNTLIMHVNDLQYVLNYQDQVLFQAAWVNTIARPKFDESTPGKYPADMAKHFIEEFYALRKSGCTK